MSIKDLHELFMKSSGVVTDSRKIKNNCIFFSLKGENFNGNEFANSAVEKGAMLDTFANGMISVVLKYIFFDIFFIRVSVNQ